MSKDPAFLFYSSDFLTGVSDLTFEERGQYITLLCLQHQKGRLSRKVIDIAVPNAAADVLHKFSVDDKGLYFNWRLEEEADKRKKHSEKQRLRALKGWEKRKKNDATANATALPLEDDNENIDNNSILKNKLIKNQNEHGMWIESIYMRKGLKKGSIGKLLKDFNLSLGEQTKQHTDLEEYKKHFSNWLNTMERLGKLNDYKA